MKNEKKKIFAIGPSAVMQRRNNATRQMLHGRAMSNKRSPYKVGAVIITVNAPPPPTAWQIPYDLVAYLNARDVLKMVDRKAPGPS